MEIIRFCVPPVVAGLVVSLCAVAVAEVAGLTPAAPREPLSHSAVPARPEPSPAQVETLGSAPERAPAASVGVPRPRPTPIEPDETTSDVERDEPEPDAPESAQVAPVGPPSPRPTPGQRQRPRPAPTTESGPVVNPQPRPADPMPPAEPTPARPAPRPPSTLPGQVLDLSSWKLTLPVGDEGSPTEIRQPNLARFSAPGSFWFGAARRGVAFRAAAGGVTTENSSYPRSELREMTAGGATEAGWSNAAGMHVMTISQAITAVPAAKPHVVAGQVHDADDDVLMIRLEGERLFVESDGDELALLDPTYRLGTRFEVRILAYDNHLHVHYNGRPRLVMARRVDGAYFKAGCYTQSNPSKGDDPASYGEVVIHALTVRHA